jgi:hypothetical protein
MALHEFLFLLNLKISCPRPLYVTILLSQNVIMMAYSSESLGSFLYYGVWFKQAPPTIIRAELLAEQCMFCRIGHGMMQGEVVLLPSGFE